jgi:hypothetical protein
MYQNLGELLGNILPLLFFIYLTLKSFGIIKLNSKNGSVTKPSNFIKIISILGTLGFSGLLVFQIII